MRKNEFYINSKNIKHVTKNDMLIFRANCIKLKSMIRENVKSAKNIKNNLYSVKKDCGSIQIDLKKLEEEFINDLNKRAKIRSIVIAKIKTYSFKRRMTTRATIKKYVDACTSTDDACTNENEPSTNENEPCTNGNESCSNENEPCSNENEPCTNEIEPCTNEPCTNENEPCTNENEPCTNDANNDDDDDEDDDEDDDNNNTDIGKLQNFSEKSIK